MRNLMLIICFIQCVSSRSQTFSTDPCYNIIFEDNFNTLNTNNWNVQNREVWTFDSDNTWDLPANVTTQNGLLRLTLDRVTHNGRPYTGGEITSTALYTPGLHIEARVLNPAGENGISCSVWMWWGLNNNGTKNCACAIQDPELTCGCWDYHEIDFHEYFGTGPGANSMNRIWCPQNGGCTISSNSSYKVDNPNAWHTYGYTWNRNNSDFYHDDKLLFRGNTVSQNQMAINVDLWAHKWSVTNSTPMPKFFHVDYIRVFRINRSNNQCSIAINNPANLTGYTWNLKRSITFTTTVLPVNQRLSFWATNFIDLNGGLTIPTSNQEITFAIGECW